MIDDETGEDSNIIDCECTGAAGYVGYCAICGGLRVISVTEGEIEDEINGILGAKQ